MADFVKLPRSALGKDLWHNGNLARLFLYLLSKADDPISIRSAAKDTELTVREVRTAFDKLKRIGAITQVATQKTTQVATQVSICGTSNKAKSATQKTTQVATQVATQAKPQRFTPPTQEEVNQLCLAKGYHFNPESFIPFYQSKGWKVGSETMKDWEAACRTWELRWKQKYGEQFYYQIQQHAPGSRGRLASLRDATAAILQQPGNIDAYFNDKG